MLLDKSLFKKINATFKKRQYITPVPRGTKGIKAVKIVTEKTKNMWNRPIGFEVYCEIGIDLVEKSYENGYKGTVIPCIKNVNSSQFFGFDENKILFSHCTGSRYNNLNEGHSLKWFNYLTTNFPKIITG